MRHASLFTGIGGFDLAAQWMGWENVFQVEIDKFCQRVLEKNFPNVKRYGDIKQFNGREWTGKIDVLTGGFPCQPFSGAGKRKGTEDDRHLWPEMLRVIREIQPSYVVGENVYGLVNWSKGMVFEQVQTSLEGEGYQVAPVILPACSVNAPHRRDRIWFVAYSSSYGIRPTSGGRDIPRELSETGEWIQGELVNQCPGDLWTITNTTGIRCERDISEGKRLQRSELTFRKVRAGYSKEIANWSRFPTQSGLCRRDDGIPNRVDRIKSLGNAIVPQVAFEIFKAIESVG